VAVLTIPDLYERKAPELAYTAIETGCLATAFKSAFGSLAGRAV